MDENKEISTNEIFEELNENELESEVNGDE